MYPFIRLAWQTARARREPRMGLFDTHVSRHLCWPVDLDLWVELNNGRTLTIYDLGRIPLGIRTGLFDAMRREGWGLTVAGSVVRYRRRVRLFDRITMKSRVIGWDDKFIYIEQGMFVRGDVCTSHAVFRTALTDGAGIVRPDRVLDALGHAGHACPAMPDWVAAWSGAEAARPWPPMADA